MDPVTHSFFGAALSRAGLHRTTPLATATLVIAANAPDIDVLFAARGSYASLAFRRGITHGPVALLLLPLLVTGVMLAYDRLRRRRTPTTAPARAGPLLGLAFLGVLTHAPLDWLNTYGVRLLHPLNTRWFYGDALFIIDPWVWLALATVVVAHTRSRRGWIAWFALAAGASMLMWTTPQVALPARIVWLVALALVALGFVRAHRSDERPGERWARGVLTGTAAYIVLMIGASALARRITTDAARSRGFTVTDVMVAPAPANPFAGDIVVHTPRLYQLGAFHWLAAPRVRWGDTIPLGPQNATVIATLQLEQVRHFLRWSRYPYVVIETEDGAEYVRWGDARYPARIGGGLSGVRVQVK